MSANAHAAAMQAPDCALKTRLLMHCHHRLGQPDHAMALSAQLGDGVEDQMSLAALLLMQNKHQVRWLVGVGGGCGCL